MLTFKMSCKTNGQNSWLIQVLFHSFYGNYFCKRHTCINYVAFPCVVLYLCSTFLSRYGESNYQRPCHAYSWVLCSITQSCFICSWAGLVSLLQLSDTFNLMDFLHELPLLFLILCPCSDLHAIVLSTLSLALIARQNNYVRPILTSESVLDIRNGRFELLCPMSPT